MRRIMIAAGLCAVVPGAAWAHVTVAPREAKPGVEQQYTVRVPTEGQVDTTSVFLEVPEGVTVLDVPAPEGATYEVKREGTRIVAITWKKEIPPRERAEFLFKATEPALRPIRRFLPDLGGIDVSPIVLLLIIFFIRQLLWTTVAPLLVG